MYGSMSDVHPCTSLMATMLRILATCFHAASMRRLFFHLLSPTSVWAITVRNCFVPAWFISRLAASLEYVPKMRLHFIREAAVPASSIQALAFFMVMCEY